MIYNLTVYLEKKEFAKCDSWSHTTSKISGQNILQKVRKATKLDQDIRTLISAFNHFCPKLDFSGKTGHCPVSPPNCVIFFSFPNFLRSQVLSFSTTREPACTQTLTLIWAGFLGVRFDVVGGVPSLQSKTC